MRILIPVSPITRSILIKQLHPNYRVNDLPGSTKILFNVTELEGATKQAAALTEVIALESNKAIKNPKKIGILLHLHHQDQITSYIAGAFAFGATPAKAIDTIINTYDLPDKDGQMAYTYARKFRRKSKDIALRPTITNRAPFVSISRSHREWMISKIKNTSLFTTLEIELYIDYMYCNGSINYLAERHNLPKRVIMETVYKVSDWHKYPRHGNHATPR